MNRRMTAIVLATACGLISARCPAQFGRPTTLPVWPDPSSEASAEVGRTSVVALVLDSPMAEDRGLIALSSDTSLLRVLGRVDAAKGASVLFVRVVGVHPGRASIAVGGKAVAVDIRPSHQNAAAPAVPQRSMAMVSPAPGAAVWGTFSVCVEWFQERPTDGIEVFLEVEGSRRLSPMRVTTADRGPVRRAAFEVDADALGAGPIELRPVWRNAGAGEADDGEMLRGEPVAVHVVHPSELELASGEAEGPYEVERPERFKRPPVISKDPAASGGSYVNNAGADGVVCFPIDVESPGWYQLIVRAAGDAAMGELPTIGVVIDGGKEPVTNGRIAEEQWHRCAIGVPFRLDHGRHLVSPWFANDFNVGKIDRNLRLDRIEVARVEGGSAAPPGAPGEMAGAAMMQAAGMAPMMAMSDAFGEGDAAAPIPLTIALTAPLEGRKVTGRLSVEGLCAFPGLNQPRTPLVTLMLNGDAYSKQRALAPKFEIDATALRAGENTVQLVAESGPSLARTPIQQLSWSGPVSPRSGPVMPACYRFTAPDERWDAATRPRIGKDRPWSEPVNISFYSEATSTLALPDDLEGRFEVLLEARGEEFQGRPIAAVSLDAGTVHSKVGEVQVPGHWDIYRVGEVEIPRASGRLISVAFTNDKYVPKKDEKDKEGGDRNLWVQALVLRRIARPSDAAPAVQILYPPEGHAVWRQDAVVIDAADASGLASAELLIDGKGTGLARDARGRTGPLVMPLIARDLSPGRHSLAVRVTGASGKGTTTPPVGLQILGAPPIAPGAYDRAITLLDRFAFGPDEAELAAVLTMGEEEWLRDRLSRGLDEPGDRSAHEYAWTRYPDSRNANHVTRRVFLHAATTPNPVRARFVLWAENHFSTWIRKTEPDQKSTEHESFAHLGVAPFLDLLVASARSPAMLRYLDQERSYAGRINENYAREIMELHTLGVHGGYTQEDVTTLATLLTGWTCTVIGDGTSGGEVRGREFRFEPGLSDGGPARFLGSLVPPTQAADRYDRIHCILETLAAHPSTAQFICRELTEHYVGAPAPDALVADLASEYTRTGGDMASVLLVLSRHPAFWSAPARLAHPLDFAERIARTCEFNNTSACVEFMSACQCGLFDRPTPDGYPEMDERYADSNAMRQRWLLGKQAEYVLLNAVPGPLRFAKDAPERWEQQAVDLMAVRLTGRLLGDESNKAALDIVSATPGNRDAKLREAAGFIAALPESSLR